MPVATFPGTVTPLRGLAHFVESERDVFFGRDRERDEIARLVTGDGFRAGLLFGEAGVGKTSLLRAGLIPDLRDHGVVALFCENPIQPLESLAHSLTQTTGQSPREGELPVQYLQRIVGEAMAGQLFLFILDGIADALEQDDRVSAEIGDLFARVVSRSAGRARFLFSSASSQVHAFGHLEKRTGSLFPPNSRYELSRMPTTDAALVLERTIALAGIEGEHELAGAVVDDLGRHGPILPADLQIAAIAIKELGVQHVEQFRKLGGFAELQRSWIESTAQATSNQRAALRLLAEFASSHQGQPLAAEAAAASGNLDAAFARQALPVLQSRGVLQGVPVYGTQDLHYALTHEILAPRIREIAAPAQQSARRAFELLGSKAAQRKRLSISELWQLRREGITATTSDEIAVFQRTLLRLKIALGVIAAFPVLLVIIAYVVMSGSYYLDTARGDEGVDTIVVRAGKPGWGWFDWLPKSPSFGSIVADTGLSRRMVDANDWERMAEHDVTGELDGESYAGEALAVLEPTLRHLIVYATKGDVTALIELQNSIDNPEELTRLLAQIAPITRGEGDEVSFIAQALQDPAPAVQTAALEAAVAAAARRPGAYADVLARALASNNSELRRLAFSAVRGLSDESARALYRAALALEPEEAAQRELLALVSIVDDGSSPSATSATSVLLGKEVSKATRAKAHALLRRAFEANPASASQDAAELIGNSAAAAEDRVFAMELLLELAPEETYDALLPHVKAASQANEVPVQAAALPLFAKLSGTEAAGELAILLEKDNLPTEMRVAVALAWGQVARVDRGPAQVALEQLLKDPKREVRAAAASAYGYLGRVAQPELSKIVKKEFIDVATSAAYGLANSASAGAPVGSAVGGIRELWKRKGRPRRIAAEVYARMARDKPSAVLSYLTGAARSTEDEGLHIIGVQGLCNAHKGGYRNAARELARVAADPAVEVRLLAIQCVADYPQDAKGALAVAVALAEDGSGDVRAEAARVLAMLAEGSEKQRVGPVLAKLAKDDSRAVRVVATRALAVLGSEAPADAIEALPRAFEQGDETEKLAILDAATKIGAADLVQMGISDSSPLVRIAAIDTAIGTQSDVTATLNSALTDPVTAVRRAALERLATSKHGMKATAVNLALALAIRDSDPSISDLALTTLARLGDPSEVAKRLAGSLASRSERVRAQAATACLGLVQHDPKLAIALLEPVLEDVSHDVRVAALRSLATAYASALTADEIAERLQRAEKRANRRLVLTAAFLVLAQSEGGREAARSGLQSVVDDGPPLARRSAELAIGLLDSNADGIAFLKLLVP